MKVAICILHQLEKLILKLGKSALILSLIHTLFFVSHVSTIPTILEHHNILFRLNVKFLPLHAFEIVGILTHLGGVAQKASIYHDRGYG